jgi:hypothetical protein
MRSNQLGKILGSLATAAAAATVAAAPAFAQGAQGSVQDLTMRARGANVSDSAASEGAAGAASGAYRFKSREDSLAWARSRRNADQAKGFHLVVSLQDRHLWAIIGEDTVLSAPVAVAKGTTLKYGKKQWTFETPRGIRTVLGKEADPIWQPPEWLYAETALEYGLKLGHLNYGQKIKLSDGRILTVQDGEAGIIDDGKFAALPTDEHIVFDNTLYVPPSGSKNRKVEGELGKYRLLLGDGYLLHGTPYKESIGLAASHGCVRMRDEDIEWLYQNVPVGTKGYIY